MKPKSALDRAVTAALKGIARGDGGPFGAVIIKGRRVLAEACNTVLKKRDPTCHAEINAIRLAAKKLRSPFLTGCVIYSTTEPCPMCFSALHWAKIKQIVYSTRIQDVKKLGFNELSLSNKFLKRHSGTPVRLRQIPHTGCRDLLVQWSKTNQKKTY